MFLKHRFEQTHFLARSKGLGKDDHLVLTVNSRDTVVPLHHTVSTGHLGALVVDDVALDHVSPWPALILSLGQPVVQLLLVCSEPLDCLLLLLPPVASRSARIVVIVGLLLLTICHAVFLKQDIDGSIDLGAATFEVLAGATPLLGAVRRDLAPIDGEHLFSDQAFSGTEQEDVAEQGSDFIGHGGDKRGDSREVRMTIRC